MTTSLPYASTWPVDPQKWRALANVVKTPGASRAQTAQLAWRWATPLAARLLRLDALLAIPIAAPLGPNAALHIAQHGLYRALIEAQRTPTRPQVMNPLIAMLEGHNELATEELTQILAPWSLESGPANASEQALTQHYLDQLAALERKLTYFAPSVNAARNHLSCTSGDNYRFNVLTYFVPEPPGDGILLPGIALGGTLLLRGGDAPRKQHTLKSLAQAATQARRVIESSGKTDWHIDLEIDSAPGHKPGQALPLEGASAGLSLLATFHFAVGHRNPLPHTVGFTGEVRDGSVHAISGIAAKMEVAAAHGVRVLFCPQDNERDVAASGGSPPGLTLVYVPRDKSYGPLIQWLEQEIGRHFPSVYTYTPERLHFFLQRARGHVSTGGRANAQAEFAFIERVTAQQPTCTLSRNVHAVALAGMGRAQTHATNTADALTYFDEAETELTTLATERRLLPVATETYFDIDNLRAVAWVDLLRYERAEQVVTASIHSKELAGALCSQHHLATSYGTFGQVLTYRAALDPTLYPRALDYLGRALEAVEPEERDRERIYLATARLRSGQHTQALAELAAVVETNAHCGTAHARQHHQYALVRWFEAACYAHSSEAMLAGHALRPEAPAWLRAMVCKWQAALAAATDPQTSARLFNQAEALLAADTLDTLHPDQTLVASMELQRTRLACQNGDLADAKTHLHAAIERLTPFVHAAAPAECQTVTTLLEAAGGAGDNLQELETAATALAKALPY